MQCIYLNSDGTFQPSAETIETCQGYVLISANEAASYLYLVQITSSTILESFTWGFGVVVLFGFISANVKYAQMLIRKL